MNEEMFQKVTDELFYLALYTQASPETKGRLFRSIFPEVQEDYLEWTQTGNLTSNQKKHYSVFKQSVDLIQETEKYKKNQVGWITIFDADYPELLRQTYAAPLILFYKGNKTLLSGRHLGVVGSRKSTSYGMQVVKSLLPAVVDSGISIVSGLAKGIDAEAHRTTIDSNGKTIAVIGCGLDVIYPKENHQLYNLISKHHLLLSEYPLGTKPMHYHFPQRNRIIAGLSQGVLVIEAKQRSGSLITARQALNEGREVFAVPGSIFSEHSVGCHELIQVGAKLTLSAQCIMEEIRPYFT